MFRGTIHLHRCYGHLLSDLMSLDPKEAILFAPIYTVPASVTLVLFPAMS